MRKALLLLASASIIVVGCTKNDSFKETKEIPIGFTKVYIEKGTKAITTGGYTTANFETVGNTFGVFGYKQTDTQTDAVIFNNQKVEYKSGLSTANGYDGTTDWAYTPIKYWDKSANEYNFYAYAPYDGDFEGTASLASQSANAFKISGFKQAHTRAAMIDLMTDLSSKTTVTGAAIGKNDVSFVFNHILSNINFEMALSSKLKNDSVDNPVTVVSVTLDSIKMDGTYQYETNKYAWTLAGSSTIASFEGSKTNSNVFASNELKASDVKFLTVPALDSLLFVPQTVDSKYNVKIEYKIKDEIFDKIVKLSDFKKADASLSTWEPGNKYTYRLIIGPDPILFDVDSISDWGNGGIYTYTIE